MRTTGRARRLRRDAGAATAEFAMVLPAFVLVVLLVAGAGSVGLAQLHAYDAARAGAREAARGEDRRAIEKEAKERAGDGSAVDVHRKDEYSTVTVRVPVPESLHFLVDHVEAEATARTEGS